MRFNSEAYVKAFPRKEPSEHVESVAEKFTPTTDKLKESGGTQPDPQPDPRSNESEGEDDGSRRSGESDIE